MPLPGPLRLRLRRAPPLHQHRRRLRLQPPARRPPRSRGRCFARRWMSASVSRRRRWPSRSCAQPVRRSPYVPASAPSSPAFSGDAPAADSVARNLADDMESLELVAPYVWLLPGMLVFGTQGARRGQLGQLVSVKAVDSFDAPRAAELHTRVSWFVGGDLLKRQGPRDDESVVVPLEEGSESSKLIRADAAPALSCSPLHRAVKVRVLALAQKRHTRTLAHLRQLTRSCTHQLRLAAHAVCLPRRCATRQYLCGSGRREPRRLIYLAVR
jgi:hypothetical protein